MTLKNRKVAIIGGGAAGLVTAKVCRENNLSVRIFEQNDYIGGTWVYEGHNYNKDDASHKAFFQQDGSELEMKEKNTFHSSLYKSLKTNLPKEIMRFSDFPFDRSVNSFPRHEKVLDYLQEYAQHFDLYSLISFNSSVTRITLDRNNGLFDSSWTVYYKNTNNITRNNTIEDNNNNNNNNTTNNNNNTNNNMNQINNHVEEKMEDGFDSVLVCNGHYTVPHMPFPQVPGAQSFPGQVFHSHYYREPLPHLFQDRTVIIVGGGASGVDISEEVSQIAKRVILSTKTGKNPLRSLNKENQNQNQNQNNDSNNSKVNENNNNNKNNNNNNENNKEEKQLNSFDVDVIGDSALPTILRVAPIERFESDGTVVFQDGYSCIADIVIYATGYKYSFPFLTAGGVCREDPAYQSQSIEDDMLRVSDPQHVVEITDDGKLVKPLYKQIFSIANASLGFIGLPFKVIPFRLFEMQATFAAQVLAQRVDLPTTEEMLQHLQKEHEDRVSKGRPIRHAHMLAADQWEYFRSIGEPASGPIPEKAIEEIYNYTGRRRKDSPVNYRRINFEHEPGASEWRIVGGEEHH